MTQTALDDLVELLDLEAIEVNLFRGNSPDESRQRVFGGQVAGQALVAAVRTVDSAPVHSLHAYFLRPGDPNVPILYQVDRIRDGKSFTTRRVVAIQHGEPIFNLQASFHADEEATIAHASDMPDVPAPDTLPDFHTRMAPFKDLIGDHYDRPRPIDTRHVDFEPGDRRKALPPFQRTWFRADGTLPDKPALHECVMTYASDMTLLDTALLPHGGEFADNSIYMASLDHAMWFHRPFRADEWLLYSQDTPSASGARALARGLIYTERGELVASVVQEGLIRRIRS
jgi:acyl-CoA thioesterase-2